MKNETCKPAIPNKLMPKPFGPVPSERQLAWHQLEFYGFIHFTVNTFTDKEWGYGDESPDVFAPASFDADQIAEVAASGGMAGLILTCKHHDGFCLWPSKFTEHSVKRCPWKNGKGDMVREISDACRRRGLKFGAYLSPWDRNHPEYGRPAYVDYYRKQLEELTTEYGELFEVWFDGANGGDGYYGGARETRHIDRKNYYDWKNTWQIVRRNQPGAMMFSDVGPDTRWVGNEEGIAGDPCWSTLSTKKLYPGFGADFNKVFKEDEMLKAWASDQEMLNRGDRHGDTWLPAECDVSIRPGWFYHQHEDSKVRSPENLLDLYFRSVGRGASFLLNLPPDRRGLIHENDACSLKEFKRSVDRIFSRNLAAGARVTASNVRGENPAFCPENLLDGNRSTYWAADDGMTSAEIVLEFPVPVTFNVMSLRECIQLGQRVDEFSVEIDAGGEWREYARCQAVGPRRLVRGDDVSTRRLRLKILKSAACPALSEIGVYYAPKGSSLPA